MSDQSVKYICFTIISCFALTCISIFCLLSESKKQEQSTKPTLEQKPINLQELLTPKSVFPDTNKLKMPNSKNSTYAG